MAKFILALYDDPSGFVELSPEQMQNVIGEYMAWSAKVEKSGHLIQGEKLTDGEGRVLRGGDKVSVTDGPYSEAKEVLGGFTVLKAKSYDEVQKLCKDHPHLKYGGVIEIREIEEFH